MAVNLANEVWQEIKRYVNGMDRAEAAESLVSVLIDNDISAEEIKAAFKSDSEVKQALKQYLDDHAEDDDEYDDEDRWDEEEDDDDY
jgi:hypothetical protein